MRSLTLLALLLALPFAPASAAEDFSGAWVAWLCPQGMQRESGKCANFVLELHQKDDQLCGAHFFSTAGAERIDEGMAPSITGEITNGTANIIAVSTRTSAPVRVRVEMKRSAGGLQWQRLENPAGDFLLPQSTRLTKSKSKTLFAPVFEHELKAACASAFTIAAEKARAQAPAAPADARPLQENKDQARAAGGGAGAATPSPEKQ